MPVAVYRSPVADDAVIAAMQRRNPGAPITFAHASAPAGSTSAYRIVVAFGAPPAVGCSPAPAGEARPTPGRTDVSAAFCTGGRVLSEASASGPPIDAAEDPRLKRLMQDLLSALMPYNDPSQNLSGSGGSGM